MRMRVVKPAFWKDRRMAVLAPQVQMVYIGLWMLSDDAGWSSFDAEEMAAELFPYRDPRGRLKTFNAAVATLEKAGRIQLHECGHAHIPKLAVHQAPGRPTYATREEHRRNCGPISKGLQRISEDSAREGKGSGVKGSEGRREESSIEEPFGAREEPIPGGLKARLGDFHEIIGRTRH